MRSHTSRAIGHRRRGGPSLRTTEASQRGSALIIALTFMIVFTMIIAGLLGVATATTQSARNQRDQRDVEYTVDGALDGAVNWVARTPNLGRDPEYFKNDPACVYEQPALADTDTPPITVVCGAEPGSDSGRQEELGALPPAAVLTLGRRLNEPGMVDQGYNRNVNCPTGPEEGLLLRQVKNCSGLNQGAATEGSWRVVGPVVSNSSLRFSAGTITATSANGGAARVTARSSCQVQSNPTCTTAGEGSTDTIFNDPGYAARPLTVDGKTGGAPLQVRSMPGSCSGPLTKIQPGIYMDAGNVNNLFASPSCRDKWIWFEPGVYYFNFTNSGNSFSNCGNLVAQNGFPSFGQVRYEPSENRHLWCIGATNNTNVHVVGGTPYGWDGANPPALGLGFPRAINTSTGDPGGDCDPTKAGVQFIFGGDSRMYVADGNVELCAGPDPNSPSNKPQIPIYGVPALNEPTATTATGGAGITGANGARAIGEPGTRLQASLNYTGHCGGADDGRRIDCFAGFGGGTIRSEPLTLSGFGSTNFSIPAGTQVQKVEMRASYDSNAITDGTGTAPQFRIRGSGFDCGNNTGLSAHDGLSQELIDVTSCLGGGNAGRLTSGFSVDWWSRGFSLCAPFVGCQGWTDTLEGVQFIVTVAAVSASTLNPGSGCIVAHPNYQDGIGDPDCPLFKVDQTSNRFTILSIPIAGSTGWVGRASFKGTIYAPSAAIDFADEDVQYPLFSRGIIARHLRLKSFFSQGNVPISDVQLDPKVFPRRVTFTACVQGPVGPTNDCDPANDEILGSAEVVYRVDTQVPENVDCYNTNTATQAARCPEIQDWQVER